ncbi:hypothetical protein LCGC14_2699320, partial [marine sediment metagenome]
LKKLLTCIKEVRMDLDWVVCSFCGNVQEEDCDNDSFVCDECDEIFHYERPD